jgi:6-pyruvoyltetrahydropterin/6-carboxytetrahydropterin synthase
MLYQTITRKGSFDSAHRVMNEKMKCFNLHGHTYLYELTFKFSAMEDIGYAIDFKEIKRVACQWIDDYYDHGVIVNPKDEHIIQASLAVDSKIWYMSLNGVNNYCNPTVENIAKEMFIGISTLVDNSFLEIEKIRLYETPNCFTDCFSVSYTEEEKESFLDLHRKDLEDYKEEKGVVNYDDRK